MKQHFKQAQRGLNDKSQHFEYIEFPKAHKREMQERDKPKTKLQRVQFPRLSDYFPDQSSELQVPLSDGSITNSYIISMDTDPSEVKEPSQVPATNIVKTVEKAETAPADSVVKQSPPKKHENPYKELISMPVVMESRHKFSSNLSVSPFAVPSNISEIKPKESYRYSGRNSEQFLLDLLNQQQPEGKKEQEKLEIEGENNNKETKKAEPVLPKVDKNPRKSEKFIQKPEPKPEIKPETKLIPQQIQKNQPKPQDTKKQLNNKPKRVTINDRGKIKFPNESCSYDYERILPPEFRAELEDSRKRRMQICQESDDEDDRPIPSRYTQEPMDIVDPQKQAEEIEQYRLKESMKQKVQKLTEIAMNAPKPSHANKQKDRKAKVTRICDNTQRQENRQASRKSTSLSLSRHNISRHSINAVAKIDTNLHKRLSEQKVEKKHKGRKPNSKEQQKGKKMVKTENDKGRIVQDKQDIQSTNVRTTRQHKPLRRKDIWEKPIYSKRNQFLGMNPVSGEVFCQILGFHNPTQIRTGPVYFTGNRIQAKIYLNSNTNYPSDGISLRKMNEHKLNLEIFNILTISLCEKNQVRRKKDAQMLQCSAGFVDVDLGKENMVIRHKMSFDLNNVGMQKAVEVFAVLEEGDPEEEDENNEEEKK